MRLPLLLIPLSAILALGGCQSSSAPTDTDANPSASTSTVQTAIRGSAFYFEKLLLPPGSTLRVQLIDNQLADTPKAVVAQQTFGDLAGPPFVFSLPYDASKLRENGNYGLHANLSGPGGELLFVTDTRVPVTPGSAEAVVLRMIRVVAPASGGDLATAGETRWQCEEMIVAIRFAGENAGENAELRMPGTRLQLRQQTAASGAKYGDAQGNAFWMKGDKATLSLQGDAMRNCMRTKRIPPWDEAKARGVVLRASGNEPGWIVEVDRGQAPVLRAILDYGERKLEVASAQPLPTSGDATGFRGTAADGSTLELRVRREPCRDDMSGHPFPASAELVVGDRSYRGCAAFLDD